MCVGFTFCFEHNFIQLQLSFLSGIVKHQISCRGLKPNFQHNTIIKLIIKTVTFATILWNSPVFGSRFPPLFKHPSLTFWQLLFPPLESPLRADVGPFPLELRVLEPEKSFDPFLLVLSVYDFLPLWFFSAQPQHHREILRPPRQQSWEGRRRHSQVFWAFWLPAEERFRWKHPLVKQSPLLLVSLMGQTLRESHWATSCRSLAEFELSRKYSQSHWPMVTFWATNWTLTWIQIGYLHGMKVHTWCSFHQKPLHQHWGWLLVLSPIFPRKVEVTSSCL